MRRAALLALAVLASCSDDTVAPGTCTHNGRTYKVGETFPAGDTCNTCRCDAKLMVSCTLIACPGKDAGLADRRAGERPVKDSAKPGEAGACAKGALAPLGQVCVRGEAAPGGGETLGAGVLRVLVTPQGCLSSSCTARHETSCTIGGAGTSLTLAATFCLEHLANPACTADCNGGGFAECSTPSLAAGSYTITAPGITLSFTVPSTVPTGGLCQGQRF